MAVQKISLSLMTYRAPTEWNMTAVEHIQQHHSTAWDKKREKYLVIHFANRDGVKDGWREGGEGENAFFEVFNMEKHYRNINSGKIQTF